MKKIIITTFLLGFFLPARSQNVNSAPVVIPGLQEWHGGNGQFTLRPASTIVLEPASSQALSATARILQQDLLQLTHIASLPIKTGMPAAGDIFLSLDKADTILGKEGYELAAARDVLRISGIENKGVFWGTRTLLQVLEQDSSHIHFPCGTARDRPRYEVRGFVLDAGRKFFSLDFLRQYVKFMSYYKMNDFHIHLNDNGSYKHFNKNWDSTYAAFRLQSDFYPALTAKDGSYSKQEFRDLQALANAYGVNIVPEIDVPAHSLAFSQFRHEIGSKKYGMDHLDLDNPVTYQVIDSVFMEYLAGPDPVFTGPEVHIGTDEYNKEAAEQFRAFTDHYIHLVEHYGKKARLWGSLTHASGKTPVKAKDVTMNLWYNGYADPIEMKKLGYNLISTPDGWLYIVPAAGYYYDYLNLRTLYDKWEPVQVGKVRFQDGDPQIKGGSFAVWNDRVGNGITEKDVHDRVFPAMQVLAQKMWRGTDTTQAYEAFATKAAAIGEGPGANMRGKLTANNGLVLQYEPGTHKGKDLSGSGRHIVGTTRTAIRKDGIHFSGGKSFAETPVPEIGYDYTISFSVNPDANNASNAVLFSSPHATVKLKQQQTGKLGFSREGYDYTFDYTVQANRWTQIAISGDHKGTRLYVNGTLVQNLEKQKVAFPGTNDSMRIVQTLFFPLKYIGDTTHAFKGVIKDLKVWNTADKLK
ncbi:family 20 glycosylhydrolase [Chitinophaga sp. G-6-1-13]|uniref:Family 20 glycosylhydrolase n=1 Tax=Chitinophaga fulva TaxID=2728842 RepID=A0A848GPU1_9BACT|nr:family 20 glycosylhydrolase [Chitinophaga fulva]NML38803.1 family 20 glycosylhydrolase [Chitinophaga fulva]